MKIGPIELANPFCQAGLAGYSDRAMRLVARRRGCAYAVTEALLDVILLNGGEGLRRSIDLNGEDHPLAGQLIGSDPDEMSRAALILHQAGYDVIDINCACPVKKIRSKARGGHLMLDDAMAIQILRQVRHTLPAEAVTTISLRRGFDDSPESVDRFYHIVDTAWSLGYAAIRVHGRTVEQKYVGQARWSFIADVKRRYPDRTIFGSGDVFTAEDAVAMLRQTGVDLVWIARGAIGNPWIFQNAQRLLKGETNIQPPSIQEQRDALAEHFAVAMEIHGEQLAGRRMRKMGIRYSRFHPKAAEVKSEFINVHSLRDWSAVLTRWYAQDGPGVWPPISEVDQVNADKQMQNCGAE